MGLCLCEQPVELPRPDIVRSECEEKGVGKKGKQEILEWAGADPPTRVFVNSAPWTIKFVDEAEMRSGPGLTDFDDNVVGCTYPQDLTIVIGNWVPGYVQRRSLVHELLHACWCDIADGQFKRQRVKGADVEELVLSGIDQSLFSAIHDNPSLVRWLMVRDNNEAEWNVEGE